MKKKLLIGFASLAGFASMPITVLVITAKR